MFFSKFLRAIASCLHLTGSSVVYGCYLIYYILDVNQASMNWHMVNGFSKCTFQVQTPDLLILDEPLAGLGMTMQHMTSYFV